MNYIANIPLIAIIYWLIMVNPYYCCSISPTDMVGIIPSFPVCFTLSSAGLRRCLAVPSMCHALRVPGDNAPKRKSWRIGPSSAGEWRDPQGESRMYFLCEICKELSYIGFVWKWMNMGYILQMSILLLFNADNGNNPVKLRRGTKQTRKHL